MEKEKIIEVKDLKLYFDGDYGTTQILNGITFDIHAGETLGIVGESGCGKSQTAMSIMRLNKARLEGEINFKGQNVLKLPMKEMRKIRGNEISMIFQDPMTCLNPVFTIGHQLSEVFRLHQGMNKQQAWQASIESLKMVNIPMPEKRVKEYPHQLSGGMRQRVMIAMALACKPQLLIADEPTTALDVTIQAQVLDLMKNLRKQYQTSLIMITHDLGIVADICDEVAVMYAGTIVEKGTLEDVFNHTKHPYTEGLFNSLPNINDRKAMLTPIKGLMPDPTNLPEGCPFHPRCPYADEDCKKPQVVRNMSDTHYVRCGAYDRPGFHIERKER